MLRKESLNRKIKVWYLTAGMPAPAGIEAHVAHYAVEMKNRGMHTSVVSCSRLPRKRHRFLEQLDAADINVTGLSTVPNFLIALLAILAFPPWSFLLLLKGKKAQIYYLKAWLRQKVVQKQLATRLVKEAPDLIHVFGRLAGDLWEVLPSERTIYHEMMTGTNDGSWDEAELAAFKEFVSKNVKVFAPGEGVAKNLRKDFGITREITPVFTICPEDGGMKTETGAEDGGRRTEDGKKKDEGGNLKPEKERRERAEDGRQKEKDEGGNLKPEKERRKKVFGIICRFVEQKGIEYLLEALKCFNERNGDVNFLFVGHGPLENFIKQFIESNKLQNVRVKNLSNPVSALKEIDVFVHPSLDDAMPMALAESLMYSVPVIASRVGGISNLIRDEVEGFLIEPRRPDEIHDRMERFSLMPESQLSEFRARARARYEEVCTAERVGDTVESIYREVIIRQQANHR